MRKSLRKMIDNNLRIFKDNSLKSILLKGSGGAFLLNVISAGLAFGVQVLLARLLGVSVYGDYTYVISWIAILTLFGRLGLDTASLRFISEYYVQEKWDLLRGFLKRSFQIVLLASGAIALILVISTTVMGNYFNAELKLLFLLAVFLIPLNSLLEVGGTFLRGFKYVFVAIAPRAILHPILLALGTLLVYWGTGGRVSAASTILINLAVSSIILLMIVYYLFKVFPSSAKGVQPAYYTKEWLRVALPLFLISGLHLILIRTDVLMIGALAGTTDAGIYSAASKVTEIMLFGQNSVMFIFAPMISELYSKGDKEQLQRMVNLATGAILAISLPLGIGLLLAGNYILALFGALFTVGYKALGVLIIGQIIIAFLGISGWLLSMTGHQKENALVVGLNVILNFILNALLIPYWGISGAAVATTLSIIIANLLLTYLVWKRLKVVPFKGIFKLKIW